MDEAGGTAHRDGHDAKDEQDPQDEVDEHVEQDGHDANATPPRALLLADGAALARFLAARLAPVAVGPSVGASAGTPAGRAEFEGWPQFPLTDAPPRQAAVLAPLYTRAGAPWMLFTRRASNLPSHSGEISFPGGSREPDDANLAQTALRESYEELALPGERVRLLGALPTVYSVVSNFLVTPYVGWIGEGLPPLHPQPSEVAEVIEAPLSALDDAGIYHEEVWTRGGFAHAVHFYDYGPHRIWGLTGRMLRQFLNLLPPR